MFHSTPLTRRAAAPRRLGFFSGVAALTYAANALAAPPQIGDKAPDFTLNNLSGHRVTLASQLKKGPIALIFLRGYPGYQCPLCTAQVNSYLGRAKDFGKTPVYLVYPGPADNLKGHAEEFVSGKTIPANFHFLLDPDFAFTKRYDLRWDAPNETSYPSTFVIDRKGVVQFAKISHSHGDRAAADDVLKALGK